MLAVEFKGNKITDDIVYLKPDGIARDYLQIEQYFPRQLFKYFFMFLFNFFSLYVIREKRTVIKMIVL